MYEKAGKWWESSDVPTTGVPTLLRQSEIGVARRCECQSFCFVLRICSKSEMCRKEQPSVAAQKSCLPFFEVLHGC